MRPGFILMKYTKNFLCCLVLVLVTSSCFAMVYDNRFIPLFQRPWIAPDDGRSHALINVFACTASRAYNRMSEEVPLPLSMKRMADHSMFAAAENCEIKKEDLLGVLILLPVNLTH